MFTTSLSRLLLALLGSLLLLLPAGGATPILSGSLYARQPGQGEGLAPQAVVPTCDPITTNTTWLTGNTYVVQNCTLTINSGVTLTIEPGVVVKFWGTAPGYGSGLGSSALLIDGTLNAVGTPDLPIVFTSYADDDHGGDTNENGSSTGTAGDWYGLVFRAGGSGQLEHFLIGYAGSDVFNATLGYGRGQVDLRQTAATLRHGTITSGKSKGIYIDGDGLTPTIADLTISANQATDGRGYAIYQSSINMQPSYSALRLSGNDRDEVTIGQFNLALSQDVRLGGANFGFNCGYSLCLATVPQTRTLTIEPGTLLDFRSSFGIAIGDGGSLVAEGTPSQPITFTSRLAAAGDTNQYWMGLWAQSGSSLSLNYVDLSYADDTNFGKGGLEINSAAAQVRNTRIHHNRRNGLYLYSQANTSIQTSLSNVEVSDNGEYGVVLDTSYNSNNRLSWEGGTISRNGWAGIRANMYQSIIEPTLRNLTIADNGAAGRNRSEQAGLSWDVDNLSPTLENLTLTGNHGAAIIWRCNGTINATNLAASGNGSDELSIPGCWVSGGRQWNLDAVGLPVRVDNWIEIGANALLSLSPGTSLRFDKNGYGSPIGMIVYDEAALYAVGTATQPISFTGTTATAGWWRGIEARHRAELVLRHCEIGYGGSQAANLYIYDNLNNPQPFDIQYCTIHDAATAGVRFQFGTATHVAPIFRMNQFANNVEVAVTNWSQLPLDARDNYWGHASGPAHATQNPGGQGNAVADNILFYPWLAAPPDGTETVGSMLVSTGAPRLVSPGEFVDYAVQYLNGTTSTIRSGLLVIQLPRAAEYLSSSDGGIYWPERDQVFWRLGDLAPGSQGLLSFRVRFAWGLPRGYNDSSLTIFSAENYNPDELDHQAYADYTPGGVAGVSLLSRPQFEARMGAAPALRTAYNAALAAGYSFHSAADVTRSEGGTLLEAVFYNSARRASRLLALQADGQLLVYTINGAEVSIEDSGGGMRIDLLSGSKSEWGNWAPTSSLAEAGLAADSCTADSCKRNCRWTIVTWTYIKKKAGGIIAWTALAPFTGGTSIAGVVWEVGSTAKQLYDCDLDCRANPRQYCCTAGQVRWSGSGIWDRLTNTCFKERCNATTGMWIPDGSRTCTAYGQRCVASIGGPGCTDCEERLSLQATTVQTVSLAPQGELCADTAAAGKPRCRDLDLRLAKDPNAISGPGGDLLPGQTITYSISYENEGEGRAYGVYVLNQLPATLDERTISFVSGNGNYNPTTREIFWLVGELGPKADPDSTGALTYTVALTGGLASGTVIANQAVVYFPSVPEETPTNTWVNQVQPLVALPQSLSTGYMQPLALTLSGREASGLPLSYSIVEAPHGGLLSGTAPNLTYTPAEGFSGADRFSFRVSNGSSTSREATINIMVNSNGDTTAPLVNWTSPVANASGLAVSATAVFSDSLGPLYAPSILIGFSEALDQVTLDTSSVNLAHSSGITISTSIAFDAEANQIILRPRAALGQGNYQVTVTTAVTDLAGNPLAQSYTLRFSIGNTEVYLPAVLR